MKRGTTTFGAGSPPPRPSTYLYEKRALRAVYSEPLTFAFLTRRIVLPRRKEGEREKSPSRGAIPKKREIQSKYSDKK